MYVGTARNHGLRVSRAGGAITKDSNGGTVMIAGGNGRGTKRRSETCRHYLLTGLV